MAIDHKVKEVLKYIVVKNLWITVLYHGKYLQVLVKIN